MTKRDDKHDDHDLAAFLDGRDGVSAAYRETAHEEPPAALDRVILQAAREAVQKPSGQSDFVRAEATPSTSTGHGSATTRASVARKPYALAASVMIAVAGLSLYVGMRDDLALQSSASPERVIQPGAPIAQDSAAKDAAAEDASAQALQRARNATTDAQAAEAERATASFEQRQLTPAVPTVSAGTTPAPVLPPRLQVRRDAFARNEEAPATVIDGPLLEQIEAEAGTAQEERQLEQIMVTGSRIRRPDDYRASRDEWLAMMRELVAALERSARETAPAPPNTGALQDMLENEIELFLEAYPDTDIDAELGLK